MLWQTPHRTFDLSRRGVIMGVVNVTTDSFSDGGRFIETEAAVEQALRLVEEGAEIIDVGGESTRPGAEPMSEAEEMRRVLPVIEKLGERSTFNAQNAAFVMITHIAYDSSKRTVCKFFIIAHSWYYSAV